MSSSSILNNTHQLVIKELDRLSNAPFKTAFVVTRDKISLCKNKGEETKEQLKQIALSRSGNGVGILTTKETDYVCFDCDAKDANDPKKFSKYFLFAINDASFKNKICVSRSPSGGYHLLVRTTNKSALQGDKAWAKYNEGSKQKTIITGRKDNQYTAEYPTPNYQYTLGDFTKLKVLNSDEIAELLEIFELVNEDKKATRDARKEIEEAKTALRKAERENKLYQQSNILKNAKFETEITVHDDFNNKNLVSDILEKNGFSFTKSQGTKDFYLRDGSKSAHSGWVQDNLYVNFSENAGLPSKNNGGGGRKFTAFDLITHFKYNSDYSEATKQEGANGYGKSNMIINSFSTKNVQKDIQKSYFEYKIEKSEFIGQRLKDRIFRIGITKIIGATGTGKTRFIGDLKTVKTIVVSRNITTLENYEQYDFIRFVKSDFKKSDGDANDYITANKITVSYASLENLLNTIDYIGAVFVFDEYHSLIDNVFYNIRYETFKAYEYLKTLSKTNTVILMSANDAQFFDSEIEIKETIVFKKEAKRECKITYKANDLTLFSSIDNALKNNRKVLLYTNEKEYNDDKKQRQLAKKIKERYSSKSILFFNSDNNKTDLQELTHDLTICTNSLVTGKDINTKNIACIMYFNNANKLNEFNLSILNQFFGRARHYESATFELLLYIDDNVEKNKMLSKFALAYFETNNAETALISVVNHCSYSELKSRYAIKSDANRNLSIDFQRVAIEVSKKQSYAAIRNYELLNSFFELHGYTTTQITEILEDDKNDDRDEKEADELSKKDKYQNDLSEYIESDNKEALTSIAAQRIVLLTDLLEDKEKAVKLCKDNDTALKFRRLVKRFNSQARLTASHTGFNENRNKLIFDSNYKKDVIKLCKIFKDSNNKAIFYNTTQIIQQLKRANFKDNLFLGGLLLEIKSIEIITDSSVSDSLRRRTIKVLKEVLKADTKRTKKEQKYNFYISDLCVKKWSKNSYRKLMQLAELE